MNIHDYKDQIVWIIGASSGIGAALAAALVKQGARVAISARRQESLALVAEESGAEWTLPLDINDVTAIRKSQNELIQKAGHIDRVILLSAAYAPMHMDKLDIAEVNKIVQTNLVGVFNLVDVTYPYLSLIHI